MLNLTSELAQWAEVALRAIGAMGVVTVTIFMVKLYRRWVEIQATVQEGVATMQKTCAALEDTAQRLEASKDIEHKD